MAAIQEITEQTASGTQDTGKSIAQLAELGAKLRSSVSGFKLPERRG
jgi:twitching motility protein PilJ